MTHRPNFGHRAREKERPKTEWTSEFSELNLPEDVAAGIRDAGFVVMTPVQREAFPLLLRGEDLMGQAQTGTGKTALFLLSIFACILDSEEAGHKAPLALILAPTRELAIQTYKEATVLGSHTGLRFGLFYGGKDYRKQEKTLEMGIDMAIGTPGRLLDFIRRGSLQLGRIKYLVIDEADRLLDMGFYEELTAILRRLPPKEERQSMMFSATFDARTQQIARKFIRRDPAFVEIKPENLTAEGIDEKLFHVERERKFPLLLKILEREDIPKGLIFTNMKITAAFLAEKLLRNGYKAGLLTGDLPQGQRIRILDDFRAGRLPLLVASDVASRGLDILDVTHIINYDVPQDPEDYVHRIGRTARAGKTGVAYTLACDEFVFNLPAIETYLKRRVPAVFPDEEDFAVDKAASYTMDAFRRHQRSQQRASGRGPSPSYGKRRPERGKPRGNPRGSPPPRRRR